VLARAAGGWRRVGVLFSFCVFCALSVFAAHAQTFNTLVTFDGSNGYYPSSLLQGADGNLWGSTDGDGAPSCGTLFTTTLAGSLTTLFTFDCTNGADPSGLILGTDGNFYGVTIFGGPGNLGTIYRLTPEGGFNLLYEFNNRNAKAGVPGGIAQITDHYFYGVTLYNGTLHCGTAFKITLGGVLTILHNFDCTEGANPESPPTEGPNGNFYGTTYAGGAYNKGTIYEMTPSGTVTLLHSFGATSSDGWGPVNSLLLAPDGNFYGETPYGGPGGGEDGNGTIFKITPAGVFTNLHNFNGTDGTLIGALMLGSDGHFYGSAGLGGANGDGTVFEISPTGVITTLHSFDGTDGSEPFNLIQDTSGVFYGLTNFQTSNYGTMYSLDTGLGPFVTTIPKVEGVGSNVTILGTDLTGTSAVSFNGTAAVFTVVSSSSITATVPVGATTGTVTVTTPSGTLSSNVPFRVVE
jgi:uncharacterized repeat protein (TIGR03803 family)